LFHTQHNQDEDADKHGDHSNYKQGSYHVFGGCADWNVRGFLIGNRQLKEAGSALPMES
jgi:hypothetical protein